MAPAIPPLDWQSFHLPKKGHTLQEYEDAFAGDARAGRFAVADGASESSFASSWARILVHAFVGKPGPWSAWLPAARKRWRSRLHEENLPWYAQTKVEEGAYAALVGVHFEASNWHAEAVGDSCVFQLRDDALRQSFPVRRAGDFSNQPNLLGSRVHKSAPARTRRLHLEGEWRRGDVLCLMTDALAHWCLHRVEDRQQPWAEILAIETTRDFVECIEKLRSEGMRNDDVTLIRIQAKMR
jgi:hypothetical protein